MIGHRSARFLLRERTAELHAELDGLFARTDFDSRASYAAFLRSQAAPLFAIEAAIERRPFEEMVPDWNARSRSAAMRHDLSTLQVAPPPSAAFPEFTDSDALLGALYVLEGSRLGAKFLVRSARGSRDPAVRAATAYLGHGESQPLWPAFLQILARREEASLDHEALVDGARNAFDTFLRSARGMAQV